MPQEFKVGQIVKVHSGANMPGFNGKRGVVVIEKGLFDTCIFVRFNNGKSVWCYPYEDRVFNVEILSDPTPLPNPQPSTYGC